MISSLRCLNHVAKASRITLYQVRMRTVDSRENLLKKVLQERNAPRTRVPIVNGMTIQDFIQASDLKTAAVIQAVRNISGQSKIKPMTRINTDLAVMLCKFFDLKGDIQVQEKAQESLVDKNIYPSPPPSPKDLVPRPPVITIMGHVDHGKTTLLDTLRKTRVVDQEFGGITQHIGAFSVTLDTGEKMTFLDTPGHAAFSAMRSRGAQVTDIVVLVVAADDGVMNQTIESIQYAHQANVPIIVAINKIDKHNADVERTKNLLLEHGVQPEEMGGSVQCIPISALKGTNLTQLKEAIITEAEVLEIKGDPNSKVEAVVIESKVDPNRGKVCTALVQRGTLKKGQYLVAGESLAKVRDMRSDSGAPLRTATPSTAVLVSGWRDLPPVGELILQAKSEKEAKEAVQYRQKLSMFKKIEADRKASEEYREEHDKQYFEARIKQLERGRKYTKTSKIDKRFHVDIQNVEGPQMTITVKGDVDGSIDALTTVISTYPNKGCHLTMLSYDVGQPTEGDVKNISPFQGIIYCFNVQQIDPKVEKLAAENNVQIKQFNVIYNLIDDLKHELQERIESYDEPHEIGAAEVEQMFVVTENKKKIPVAGCKCISGQLKKKSHFQLIRNGEIIHEASRNSSWLVDNGPEEIRKNSSKISVVTLQGPCPVDTMRHFKKEVSSVQQNNEFGLAFQDKSVVVEAKDEIKCIEYVKETPQLEWDLNF